MGLKNSRAKVALLGLLAAAAAAPCRAERAVGLEAQGVDAAAAIYNPQGLDVRDALGRPVSAAVIESQLKRANAQDAVAAAYSSRLPQARAVAWILRFVSLAAGLSPAWPSFPMGAVALPVLVRRLVSKGGAGVICALIFALASLPRRRAAVPALSRSRQNSVCRRC